ncbi:MAG TPA: hypothetical protein VEM93_02140 [Actinomycetota bacterium]|nr:hypothetical protein [Actinomycetota bacterium]
MKVPVKVPSTATTSPPSIHVRGFSLESGLAVLKTSTNCRNASQP